MLQTVLTVLPIVTAGLYLLGLTYHQGFLAGFGIEETLFPLSIDRTLFQGFVALITFGAKPLVYSLVATLAIFFMAVLAAVISSNQRVRRWGRLLVSRLHQPSGRESLPESATQWVDKAGTAVVYVAIIFFIFLALLVVAVVAEKSGKEQALHFIESAAKSKEGFVTLDFPDNIASVRGKPIFCSATHCAYWLGKEAVLYRNESIEKITTNNNINEEASVNGSRDHIKELNNK